MNRSIALAFALLILPVASAGTFTDATGDAEPGLDLHTLSWDVGADTVTVNLTLGGPPVTGASYSAIVYVGFPNASEPEESYIVHHGPGGTRVLTGHTDPVQQLTPTAEFNGSRLGFSFERVEPSDSSCDFAVATTSTYDGEQRVHDSIPDEDINPEEAWRAGAYCLIDPIKDRFNDVVDDLADQTGIPGPSPVLLLVGLAVFAARRR